MAKLTPGKSIAVHTALERQLLCVCVCVRACSFSLAPRFLSRRLMSRMEDDATLTQLTTVR